MNRFKIIGLLTILLFSSKMLRAQSNIFTTNNIVAATISPTPDYGSVEDLFDGDVNTFLYWIDNTLTGQTVTIQLNAAQKVGYYELTFFDAAYLPKSIQISGSNDGKNWTLLNTTSVSTSSNVVETSFNNPTAYTYYRYTMDNGGQNIVALCDIAAYSVIPPPPALTTPTLSVSAGTVGTYVNLSWSTTANVSNSVFSGYEIQRSSDGVNYSLLGSIAAPTTSYSDSTTKSSTRYWYRVRTRNDTLFSSYSTPISVVTVNDSLKTAPTLSGSLRSGISQNLSWSQIMNTSGSYELYRSRDSINFLLLKSFDKSITSYRDTLTDTIRSTYYRVRGVNYLGYSPYSNIFKVSDSLYTTPVITSATTGTIGTVAAVSWSYNVTPNFQMKIERSTDGVNFLQVGIVTNRNVIRYFDSSVLNATKYFYRVAAVGSLNTSPYSNIVSVTTLNDSLKNIPVLNASLTSGTSTTLSWNFTFNTPVAGGYEIQQSTDSINFISLGKVAKTVTSQQIQSLKLNTKYFFRVRGYNYNSNSPYSNIVAITTSNVSAIADITYDGGKLFVNAENSINGTGTISANNAEGSSKLIDHNVSTKFLVYTRQLSGTLNCIYKPTGQYIVNRYGIGTANDASTRDPRNWTFAGSNDSTTWVTLDTRTNQLGGTTARNTYFYYDISNPGSVSYKFYRLSITTNWSASDGVRFQIAEWPIYGVPLSAPNIPQSLSVTDSASSSLSLGWTQDVSDTSKHLTNFILQRGLDQLSFTTVNNKIPFTTRTYIDQGLLDSTVYYYRIQATDSTRGITTGWSSVAIGKTKVTPGIPHIPVLSFVSMTDTSATMNWVNRATNATGFKIERSRDGINFSQIDSVGLISSYTDRPLWSASTYYYRIKAFNSNGYSDYSNIISLTTYGSNNAPYGKNPIIYRKVCAGAGKYSLSFDGVVAGPNNERTQTLKVVRVTADSLSLFSGFGFDSTVVNGVVNYSFITNNTVVAGDSTNILVTVRDNGGTNNGGVDSLVIPVKIYFTPLTLTVTSDKDINNVPRYALVTLTASSSEPATTNYNWTSTNSDDIVGASNLLKLQLRPLRTETITVTATSTQGCTATTSLVVKPQDSLVVSNILTPNGDGINDKWIVWGIENMTNNSVKVVDRSGRVVFTQINYQNGWDGKFNGNYLPEGAYFYIVDYNVPNGSGGTSKIQSKGVLTIIRNR